MTDAANAASASNAPSHQNIINRLAGNLGTTSPPACKKDEAEEDEHAAAGTTSLLQMLKRFDVTDHDASWYDPIIEVLTLSGCLPICFQV